MKSYQTQDRDDARAKLGLISESKWQAVIDEIRQAEYNADVNGIKGALGAIRKCGRKLGDSGAAFTGWLRMLPDDAYGSIICGGLTLIINAAVRHRDLCNEVLDAVGEIPEVIRAAEFSFVEYRSDQLNVRIATLYKDISQSLRSILDFYKDRAPGRTKGVARNVVKAIGKGPNYGKQIELNIELVRKSASAVKQEADRCLHRRVGAIRSNQEFQTRQNAEIKDQGTENLRLNSELKDQGVESLKLNNEIKDQGKESLNLMKNLYAGLKYQYQCQERRWEERDRRQREEYASMCQRLESISRAVTPEPVRRQGPSVQQIVGVLNTSPEVASQDLRYILQEGELFSSNLQSQASAFMGSQHLQAWLTSNTSRCLFAQADSGDDNPISALSFVSGLLLQTLQTSEAALSLHYACGLHTDRYRDAFPSAEGMLQSLLAQLLVGSQYENFSLDFVDRSLFRGLENADLISLCTVFEGLIRQVPASTIIFLIVDGISFYETEDKVKGICYAISKLIELAETSDCVLKLLVTSPGMSGYVRKGFREEDILLVAGIEDGDGDGLDCDIEEFRGITGDISGSEL